MRNIPENGKFGQYLYWPMYVSGGFFIVAFLASYNGFTSATAELDFLSENRFLANILFIGFIIAINERLVETFIATLRQGDREDIERKIKALTIAADPDKLEELDQTKNDLIYYRAESRRLTLTFSIFFGSTMACLGIVKVFGALLDPTEMVSALHIALIDAADVFVAGWLVAGGSKGWNQLTSSIEAVLQKSRDLNRSP